MTKKSPSNIKTSQNTNMLLSSDTKAKNTPNNNTELDVLFHDALQLVWNEII